jgi:hypothetical protein
MHDRIDTRASLKYALLLIIHVLADASLHQFLVEQQGSDVGCTGAANVQPSSFEYLKTLLNS